MAKKVRKIATEEAWVTPEIAAELKKIANSPTQALDRFQLKGIYDAENDKTTGYGKYNFLAGLLDAEGERLRQMDELGIDMHLLSLTAPGVQMFDADTACEMAALSNDRIAELCRKYPKRFTGLASFAPHSPKRAAREIERAMRQLKLNGLIVNSHTYGEYLDDPKYWPIFEAAEAMDACIYVHPRCPSDTLKGPMQQYAMDTTVWGFGIEAGTHAVRIMAGGVFDAFPKLKICLGHLGEALPFWIWRIDFMSARGQAQNWAKKTKRRMGEYLKDNFVFTTSGMEDPLALRYTIDKMGIDNVMWAIDYPYQPMKPALDFIENFACTEAEMHALCHGNAERVFHIDPL